METPRPEVFVYFLSVGACADCPTLAPPGTIRQDRCGASAGVGRVEACLCGSIPN
jgi:hypothetical protein